MTILVWNVRGLNRPSMQMEVKQKIQSVQASLVALLETRIKPASFYCIKNFLLRNGWLETTNVDTCSSSWIWLLWNPRSVHLQVLHMEPQNIHCAVQFSNFQFYFSACYGHNNYIQRRELWQSLVLKATTSQPWVLAGDFNTLRWNHEKIGEAPPRPAGLIDFNDCIQEVGLIELTLSGSPFTWSNSSLGESRIASKLVRVLINSPCLHSYIFKW